MTDKEIKELLAQGAPQQFSLDPNMKNDITRSTLDSIIREVKKHLSAKRKVSVVLVKE